MTGSLTSQALLGLPLEDALRLCRAMGVEPSVTRTAAPRAAEGPVQLRVVRVKENELTVCGFPVHDPYQTGNGE